MSLHWTREKPTVEGAYWCRHTEVKVDVRLCQVVNQFGFLRVVTQRPTEYGTALSLFDRNYFEWAGPLEPAPKD
jgi:hypothetical protein